MKPQEQLRRAVRWLNEELMPSPPLQPTDVPTPRFAYLVRGFQVMNGLAPSGAIDGATAKLLRVRAAERGAGRAVPGESLPILLGMSDVEKFDFYTRYIVAADAWEAQQELKKGRRVILGLRVPTNSRAREGAGIYDDRLVVLWRQEGQEVVREFEANTDPSSMFEDGYEHADQKNATRKDAGGELLKGPDGRAARARGDLGQLPCGLYWYERSSRVTTKLTPEGPVFTVKPALRPAKGIEANRDTNHDGVFDGRDSVSDRAALASGKSILFHSGGGTVTGSAACQTLRPVIFEAFLACLGTQSRFCYLLLPADDAWRRSFPIAADWALADFWTWK
jgi:hypothetical protein